MISAGSENFSFAGYCVEALQTKEARNALDSIITEVIDNWGQNSSTKKIISKPAKWVIKKGFSNPGDNQKNDELLTLLKHPDLVEHASSIIPNIISSLSEIFQSMVVSLGDKSEEKQLELLSGFISSFNPQKIGVIITSLAKTTLSLHKNNPEIFSDKILPGIESFIKNTDFGILKELFENSSDDLNSIIEGINEIIFSYPAKLITILSFIPGISNHLIFFLSDLAKKFNYIPPDVFSDIILALGKEIDEKKVGELINNGSEIIRQIHTGSSLIGEAGAPQFSTELLKTMRKVIKEVDPQLVLKAINATNDGKTTFKKTLQTVVAENPEYLLLYLNNISSGLNFKIDTLKHKLEILEDTIDEETLESLTSGIIKCDTYSLAESLNSACAIANSLNEHSPEVLKKLINDFFNTIDMSEIEEFISWGSSEYGSELRPLIRNFTPIIIKKVLGSLEEKDDDNNDNIEEARMMLHRFILGKENQ